MMQIKELFGIRPAQMDRKVDISALAQKVSDPFDDPKLLTIFSNLAVALRPKLAQYDTILADDAGGRIPAILVHQWARRKREQHGVEKPNLFFIHPINNKSSNYDALQALIKRYKTHVHRVLFVTEVIASGANAKDMIKTLSKQKIRCDIASLSLYNYPYAYSFNKHLFYGEVIERLGISSGDIFHRQDDISGVFTNHEEFAASVLWGADPQKKQRAREDAALVADTLYPLVV